MTFLQLYHKDGDYFIDQIDADKKTWIAISPQKRSGKLCNGSTVNPSSRIKVSRFVLVIKYYVNLQTGVKRWLRSQVVDFFNTGTQNLVSCFDSICFNFCDTYIERVLNLTYTKCFYVISICVSLWSSGNLLSGQTE
ncbi:hypothetical protein NPIL_612771 [Nephila pilipes]|uniref:Uncharacterized protein n=1 Tax=Nephila pilipes TaxID=299642 RepID=A0A8X6N0W4_NEPPI|nr:hypothetical protein NPIL_612771 [Nephila pilipes]